jgi:SAM-dependent methyltransferase
VSIPAQKAIDISDEMTSIASMRAASFGISPSLHEGDQLLGYFINQAKMSEKSAVEAYVDGGHHDAAKVVRLLEKLKLAGSSARVLEFASGFGRVTRHLKTLSPKSSLVASDIHLEACDFIQEHIGVIARPSNLKPERLNVGENFDLIFVLSLFSHLPSKTFGSWLAALYDKLAPGGYFMFTTHGEFAMSVHPAHFGAFQFEEPGFAYRGDSDQPDIESSEYGTAIALPMYVTRLLKELLPEARLISFASGEWFGIQDEWVIQKPAS